MLKRKTTNFGIPSRPIQDYLREPNLRAGGFTQRNVREIAALRIDRLEKKIKAMQEVLAQ